MNRTLIETDSLSKSIDQLLARKGFSLDNRKICVVGSLSSSLEYHNAILILCEKKKYGSSIALLRSQFESFVKGTWYFHCASDEEIDDVYNDKLNKAFGSILSELKSQNVSAWEDNLLIKNQFWSQLCGFTHTGAPQLGRRFKDGNISPNYSEELIESMLNLSNLLAFKTLLEMLPHVDEHVPKEEIVQIISSNRMLKDLYNDGL